MGWNQVVEAHLQVARRIYPPDHLTRLASRCGFAIGPETGNGAGSYADVLRYLQAVQAELGPAAWTSAKLTVISRMRDLRLAPDLPRPERGWVDRGATRDEAPAAGRPRGRP